MPILVPIGILLAISFALASNEAPKRRPLLACVDEIRLLLQEENGVINVYEEQHRECIVIECVHPPCCSVPSHIDEYPVRIRLKPS